MADGEALVSSAEAASILGVGVDRIGVMVDEGLLTPSDERGDDGTPRFARAEVEAVRLQGG